MKRLVIYLVLMMSFAVFAQQMAEQSDESEPPVEGSSQSNTSGIDEGSTGDEGETTAEELTLDALTPDPDQEAREAMEAVAETDATEVADEVEIEFEPDEEISEDYPVPLPSDI